MEDQTNNRLLAKKIVKAVYNESNYYDSYEKVEELLETFHQNHHIINKTYGHKSNRKS